MDRKKSPVAYLISYNTILFRKDKTMSEEFDMLEKVEARLEELRKQHLTDSCEFSNLLIERSKLHRAAFPGEYHFTPSPLYPNRDLWDHP